ncbi:MULTISPECIES: hypothetical protein [Streptomycetaceae]|uniref:hypothetical protein n=1 Tax=Streptomycetaceae TaxID=2062 RepID=UPI000671078B|nr:MULTISPECIES: hypothetical protein [Streptomycetaceae]OKI08889.1 hypothetical protein AMK13_10990 [Streptomyces sp. CB02056]
MAPTAHQSTFTTVKKCITLFGLAGAIVLGTVAVMASIGHPTTPFMWIRGVIFLAVAPYLHRLATRAADGSAKAFDRVRTLSTVMPIAIIAVDLIPGLCPPWYAVLQGLSALALLAVAILTRTPALRAAFPNAD